MNGKIRFHRSNLSSFFLKLEKVGVWIQLAILPKASPDVKSFLYHIKKKHKAKPYVVI